MIALISGASSGSGKAIARKFIQENHQVILLARRQEKLQKLKEQLGVQLPWNHSMRHKRSSTCTRKTQALYFTN